LRRACSQVAPRTVEPEQSRVSKKAEKTRPARFTARAPLPGEDVRPISCRPRERRSGWPGAGSSSNWGLYAFSDRKFDRDGPADAKPNPESVIQKGGEGGAERIRFVVRSEALALNITRAFTVRTAPPIPSEIRFSHNVSAVADVRERVRRAAPKTSEACVRTPYTHRISRRKCGLAARKRRVMATVLLGDGFRCSATLTVQLSDQAGACPQLCLPQLQRGRDNQA
jgi:hypothetical protein